MSKIWEDLKHNVKEWSNAAVEKAEEVSKVAVAKTGELTKISKIKLEIHQLERDRKKQVELLGKMVYSQSKDANMVNFTGNAEFFSHVEKIDNIYSSISDKESQINKIKADYNINESELAKKKNDIISSDVSIAETGLEESRNENDPIDSPELDKNVKK